MCPSEHLRRPPVFGEKGFPWPDGEHGGTSPLSWRHGSILIQTCDGTARAACRPPPLTPSLTQGAAERPSLHAPSGAQGLWLYPRQRWNLSFLRPRLLPWLCLAVIFFRAYMRVSLQMWTQPVTRYLSWSLGVQRIGGKPVIRRVLLGLSDGQAMLFTNITPAELCGESGFEFKVVIHLLRAHGNLSSRTGEVRAL